MSLLPKPDVPVLDTDHPLYSGLRCFVPVFEDSGIPGDLVVPVAGSGTAPSWSIGPYGAAVGITASSPITWAGAGQSSYGVEGTLFAAFLSTNTVNPDYFADSSASGTGCAICKRSGVVQLLHSGGFSVSSGIAINAADHYAIAVAWSQNGVNYDILFKIKNLTTEAVSEASRPGMAITITAGDGNAIAMRGGSANVTLSVAGCAGRAWSSSEMDGWLADPFSLVRGSAPSGPSHILRRLLMGV